MSCWVSPHPSFSTQPAPLRYNWPSMNVDAACCMSLHCSGLLQSSGICNIWMFVSWICISVCALQLLYSWWTSYLINMSIRQIARVSTAWQARHVNVRHVMLCLATGSPQMLPPTDGTNLGACIQAVQHLLETMMSPFPQHAMHSMYGIWSPASLAADLAITLQSS